MDARTNWVLLAYRLPREPSTPRITLWRKLRALGALQIVDGLVALPAGAGSREQFDWLADDVIEAGGEAWTWIAEPGSKEQQRVLAARVTEAAAEEYRELVAEAEALLETDGAPGRRTLARLRRELHGIEARDPFPARERARATKVIDRLAARVAAIDEQVHR